MDFAELFLLFFLSFWCSAFGFLYLFLNREFETRSQLFLSIKNSTPAFRIHPMHTWIRAVLCGMSTVLVQMTPASLERGAASSSMTFITWCHCLNLLSTWSFTVNPPKRLIAVYVMNLQCSGRPRKLSEWCHLSLCRDMSNMSLFPVIALITTCRSFFDEGTGAQWQLVVCMLYLALSWYPINNHLKKWQ